MLTLESPLGCKEIKPVNPNGNQPWIFIGMTDAEAEPPVLWPPDVKRRNLLSYVSQSVQSFSHVWLFVIPWTAACLASPSFTVSRNMLKLMSVASMVPSNHILCRPRFFLPSISPGMRVYIPCFSASPSHLDHHGALSRVSSLCCTAVSLVIYFIHRSVYMSIPLSQCIPSLVSGWPTWLSGASWRALNFWI